MSAFKILVNSYIAIIWIALLVILVVKGRTAIRKAKAGINLFNSRQFERDASDAQRLWIESQPGTNPNQDPSASGLHANVPEINQSQEASMNEIRLTDAAS